MQTRFKTSWSACMIPSAVACRIRQPLCCSAFHLCSDRGETQHGSGTIAALIESQTNTPLGMLCLMVVSRIIIIHIYVGNRVHDAALFHRDQITMQPGMCSERCLRTAPCSHRKRMRSDSFERPPRRMPSPPRRMTRRSRSPPRHRTRSRSPQQPPPMRPTSFLGRAVSCSQSGKGLLEVMMSVECVV